VNHVQTCLLLVSFLGPTGQHTVLLISWLGAASFALYFLALFATLMPRNTPVLTDTSLSFYLGHVCFTMYEECFIVPERQCQNEVH
jgi:hypothetical protein